MNIAPTGMFTQNQRIKNQNFCAGLIHLYDYKRLQAGKLELAEMKSFFAKNVFGSELSSILEGNLPTNAVEVTLPTVNSEHIESFFSILNDKNFKTAILMENGDMYLTKREYAKVHNEFMKESRPFPTHHSNVSDYLKP